MNISLLKKELENLDDSINSKIKDSSYAPIDLTTIDTTKKSLNESLSNNKHPINNPALNKITDNIKKFRELENLDDSINSKIKDSSYAPIDLTTIDTTKKSLNESLSNNKHPINNPALNKITDNIKKFRLAKESSISNKLNNSIDKPKF